MIHVSNGYPRDECMFHRRILPFSECGIRQELNGENDVLPVHRAAFCKEVSVNGG